MKLASYMTYCIFKSNTTRSKLWEMNFAAIFTNEWIFKLFCRLPDWAQKAVEPNGPLASIAHFWFTAFSNTKEMARLYSGFLIKEMFDRFAQKINSTLQPDRSLWFYSTHETGIGGLMNSLGIFKVIRCYFFWIPKFSMKKDVIL